MSNLDEYRSSQASPFWKRASFNDSGINTKLGLMCPAQGYDTVTPMRLESVAPRSLVKHSTTELITAYVAVFGYNS